MRVSIKLFPDHISIRSLEPGSTGETFLRPGSIWNGWKYTRLRRRGDGETDLVPKSQLRNDVIELRGYAE